ncbi:unnamed protein product [Pieris brassicae]|uniref:Uncharacterized protein n=1 Tax=Pieris brassicae TaxID=7116 RepID=A0A9P0TK23_PIEBR|nr:unnamed protein product [Pieris brassicae]
MVLQRNTRDLLQTLLAAEHGHRDVPGEQNFNILRISGSDNGEEGDKSSASSRSWYQVRHSSDKVSQF